jgi:glycosyltransferase involved in cell wall biosynthesis
MSYNQERFIREAVQGAFAQTYTPLEIILSDDCSSDRTYEIMSEMAGSYCGPHRIVLNRNERNLGIGEHMNWIMETAAGELIVASAGDDKSVSERTSRVYEEWMRIGGGLCSIYSDAILIDSEGTQLRRLFEGRPSRHVSSVEEAVARGGVGVAGCTHAFSKKTFDLFGPMDGRVVAEDMVIPLRSLLAGKIQYIKDPLVLYRTHGGNVSLGGKERPTLARRYRDKENHEAVLLTWVRDVRRALDAGLLSKEKAGNLTTEIYSQLYWGSIEKRLCEKRIIPGLLLLARNLLSFGRANHALKITERRLRTAD